MYLSTVDFISYKNLRLNVLSRTLFFRNLKIPLRNKEFYLIEYFMKNIGIVLTRTDLLEQVWDQNICCSSNTVDVHVSSLRKKIKSHANDDFIQTVYCVGYIFGS